jgi:hypothetical protein
MLFTFVRKQTKRKQEEDERRNMVPIFSGAHVWLGMIVVGWVPRQHLNALFAFYICVQLMFKLQ